MSTDSPRPSPDSNPENSAPELASEITEQDLWDIDFDQESIPAVPQSAQGAPGQLPAQRKSQSILRTLKPSDAITKIEEVLESEVPEPVSGRLSAPAKEKTAEIPATESRPESEDDIFADFPDLEKTQPEAEWDEPAAETAATPAGNTDANAAAEIAAEPIYETSVEPANKTDRKSAPTITSFGPFSKIEKIAISGLCAILALGAILTLIHFSNRVPTRPLIADEIDFPVTGTMMEITEASTFWREPVSAGGNEEIVRRGTKLIPVLKLSLNSKPAAIRVFFRNEDGSVVGDSITRPVNGSAEFTIAATAGFDDVGMHTAYRTGNSKRWVVQVFEGPSATAPREKFSKVLEMDISPRIE